MGYLLLGNKSSLCRQIDQTGSWQSGTKICTSCPRSKGIVDSSIGIEGSPRQAGDEDRLSAESADLFDHRCHIGTH